MYYSCLEGRYVRRIGRLGGGNFLPIIGQDVTYNFPLKLEMLYLVIFLCEFNFYN